MYLSKLKLYPLNRAPVSIAIKTSASKCENETRKSQKANPFDIAQQFTDTEINGRK